MVGPSSPGPSDAWKVQVLEASVFSPSLAELFLVDFENLSKALPVFAGAGTVSKGSKDPFQGFANPWRGVLICQAVIGPAPLLADAHKLCLLEDGHVLRNRGGGETQKLDQLTDAEFPPPKGKEKAHSSFIRKGLCDGEKLFHWFFYISANGEL